MNISNFNMEIVKKNFPVTENLPYPSVIKRKRPWGAEFWLALYMVDGIPQHCQCASEEEGWYLISHIMGKAN